MASLAARLAVSAAALLLLFPNATTYGELVSRFNTTTLHGLLGANGLPPDTSPSTRILAKTTVRIPFRCRCAGNGVGQSDHQDGLDAIARGVFDARRLLPPPPTRICSRRRPSTRIRSSRSRIERGRRRIGRGRRRSGHGRRRSGRGARAAAGRAERRGRRRSGGGSTRGGAVVRACTAGRAPAPAGRRPPSSPVLSRGAHRGGWPGAGPTPMAESLGARYG
ncbi:hypothetical protein ACP70R_001645 [Stipagrostis hirtigluma subsp. patula]